MLPTAQVNISPDVDDGEWERRGRSAAFSFLLPLWMTFWRVFWIWPLKSSHGHQGNYAKAAMCCQFVTSQDGVFACPLVRWLRRLKRVGSAPSVFLFLKYETGVLKWCHPENSRQSLANHHSSIGWQRGMINEGLLPYTAHTGAGTRSLLFSMNNFLSWHGGVWSPVAKTSTLFQLKGELTNIMDEVLGRRNILRGKRHICYCKCMPRAEYRVRSFSFLWVNLLKQWCGHGWSYHNVQF